MRPLLVVCGLNREAALAAGRRIETLAGGGSRDGLEARLATLDPSRYAAVLSFGLVGALSPALKVGDVVAPTRCLGEAGPVAVTLPVRPGPASSAGRPTTAFPLTEAPLGLVGVDAPAATRSDKADLARRYGAQLIDMESHVAGAWAARHALPFGILRVVSDGAERDLPPLVAVAMRADGSLNGRAMLRSLVREPGQVPALLATARDAAVAFRQLRRVGRALGRGRGLLGGSGGLLGLDL